MENEDFLSKEKRDVENFAKAVLAYFSSEEILNNRLLKIKHNSNCYFLLRSFPVSICGKDILSTDKASVLMYGKPKLFSNSNTYALSFKFTDRVNASYFVVKKIICENIPYMYCKSTNWCDLCLSEIKCNVILYQFEHGENMGQNHDWICSSCFKFLGLKRNGYDKKLKAIDYMVSHGLPKEYTDIELQNYKKLVNAK